MAHGAEVNEKNADDMNALITACFQGHIELVAILLEAGAYVNARGPMGNTALIMGSLLSYPKIVEILLLWDADVNFKK